jgi:hypothetical protein
MVGSMGRVRAPGDNVAMESFCSLLQKSVRDQPLLANPRTAPDRNRHLDRTLLPPQTMTSRSQGGFIPIEFEAIMTTPASQAA